MTKRFLTVLLCALLLVLLAAPISAAVPKADLTELAQYFPAETAVAVSVRTDLAFIDELDALVATVNDALPADAQFDQTAGDLIDGIIADQYGAGYAETFGDWLGDTAMIGILSLDVLLDINQGNNQDVPALSAFEITNRAGAVAFIKQVNEDEALALMEIDVEAELGPGIDYTVWMSDSVIVAINDTVMLIGYSMDDLNLDGDFVALADDARFTQVIDLLPAADYNAIIYTNLQDTFSRSLDLATGLGRAFGVLDEAAVETIEELSALGEDLPATGTGLTVLDGRTLAIDSVQTEFDLSRLEPLFGELDVDRTPVDLAFAQHVPAGAQLVIMDADVAAGVETGLDVIFKIMELALPIAAAQEPDLEPFVPVIRRFDAAVLREYFNLNFEVFTGLDFDADFLPLLAGQSATYLRGYAYEPTLFMIDGVTVFEAVDPAVVANSVDLIETTLGEYDVAFSRDGDVITVPGVLRRALREAIDDPTVLEDAAFDWQLGFNDDVLAVGSRNGVALALTPDATLADDAAFVDAQQYFIDDTQLLLYVGFDATADFLGTLADGGAALDIPPGGADDLREVQSVIGSLLSSASITGVRNDDGSSVSRAAITLSE